MDFIVHRTWRDSLISQTAVKDAVPLEIIPESSKKPFVTGREVFDALLYAQALGGSFTTMADSFGKCAEEAGWHGPCEQ